MVVVNSTPWNIRRHGILRIRMLTKFRILFSVSKTWKKIMRKFSINVIIHARKLQFYSRNFFPINVFTATTLHETLFLCCVTVSLCCELANFSLNQIKCTFSTIHSRVNLPGGCISSALTFRNKVELQGHLLFIVFFYNFLLAMFCTFLIKNHFLCSFLATDVLTHYCNDSCYKKKIHENEIEGMCITMKKLSPS